MGVWIATGELEGADCAILVDSVTMTAFGPVFVDEDEAELFLEMVRKKGDPRKFEVERLHEWLVEWRAGEPAIPQPAGVE